MYTYRAMLDRVVDGDTVDVIIDLGFTIATRQRVRLQGLNAPERHTAAGREAAAFVRDWAAAHDTQFTIQSHRPGGGDKYGRYLATIVAEGGDCLNEALITSGLAQPWDGQGAKPTAPTRETT